MNHNLMGFVKCYLFSEYPISQNGQLRIYNRCFLCYYIKRGGLNENCLLRLVNLNRIRERALFKAFINLQAFHETQYQVHIVCYERRVRYATGKIGI